MVVIVDDNNESREELVQWVRSWGFETDSFSSPADFLAEADPCSADCFIFDVRMPGINGIYLYYRIEELGWTKPVLFVTAHASVSMAVHAIEHGAAGFIEKPVDPDDLRRHVQAAVDHAVQKEHHEQRQERVVRRYTRLTPRERQVMALIVQGLLSKQIAAELGLSVRTIEVHRLRLMRKMEAMTVADLVRIAVRHRLCEDVQLPADVEEHLREYITDD